MRKALLSQPAPHPPCSVPHTVLLLLPGSAIISTRLLDTTGRQGAPLPSFPAASSSRHTAT